LQTTKQKLFGTDGIRGRVGVFPMTQQDIYILARSLGIYLKTKQSSIGKIAIASDTRESHNSFEQAIMQGFASIDIETVHLGIATTPALAYTVKNSNFDAGIVISASHNPYHDNGVKFFDDKGLKLTNDVEKNIEQIFFSEKGKEIPQLISKNINYNTIHLKKYSDFLSSFLPFAEENKKLTVVLDCANGAAYKTAPYLFKATGVKLIIINNTPDGKNINDNCGSLYPQRLSQLIRKHQAHVGFALDGDADRLVCVDEKGHVLEGDELLAILANYLNKECLLKQSTVVTTKMTNLGFDEYIKTHNCKVLRTEVGDKHISAMMSKYDYNFGGESSGHFIFKDFSTTGDGTLTAFLILKIMLTSRLQLSQINPNFTRYPQKTVNIEVEKKVPLTKLQDFNVALINAQKKLRTQGRIFFRYSGTELLARLMIEAKDINLVDQYTKHLSQIFIKNIKDFSSKKPT
jgi:phosphoglucosamine mutase